MKLWWDITLNQAPNLIILFIMYYAGRIQEAQDNFAKVANAAFGIQNFVEEKWDGPRDTGETNLVVKQLIKDGRRNNLI